MTADPQAPGSAVSLGAQSLHDLAVGQVDELAAWLDGVGVDALRLGRRSPLDYRFGRNAAADERRW